MATFDNTPDDCPHTDYVVTGYHKTEKPKTYTQVRQCQQCGLYQNVTYDTSKKV